MLVLIATTATPALATDVSSEALNELAERAIEDASALRELQAVDSVDGRPVDVERALEGAEGRDLEQRLRALAQPSSGEVDSAAARESAGEILAQRRYREPRTPKPLKGLAERIEAAGDWIVERLSFLNGLPGGLRLVWALVAVGVIVAAAIVAGRVGLGRRHRAERMRPLERGEDPAELERAAEDAEVGGDHERALRLRFRAGILRLAERGILPYRFSLTSGQIRDTLRSATFDRLAMTFDRVAYGRVEARASDVEEARSGWRELERELAS